MKLKCYRFLTIMLFFMTSYIQAASVNDINTVFDWAESNYSQYFSPAGQTNQTLDIWTFRAYPGTGIYLGVNNFDDVYVLGGEFGAEPVIVGALSTFLSQVNTGTASTSGSSGNGNCVNLPFPNSGLQVAYRTTAPEGSVDFQTTYDMTTDNIAKTTTTSQTQTSGFTSNSTSVTTQNYKIENNYYMISSVSVDTTSTIPSIGSFTDSTSTTFSPARNEGPATQFCQGQSWTQDVVSMTVSSSNMPTGATNTTSELINGTVVAVNEPVTTTAGSFDTVKTQETSASGDTSISWFSIQHGVLVKMEVYNKSGVLVNSTDTLSLK